jgi:hypothetical protein
MAHVSYMAVYLILKRLINIVDDLRLCLRGG